MVSSNKNQNGKTLYKSNTTDSGFYSSPSLASTAPPPSNEKFSWQRSFNEKSSISEKLIGEKLFSEKLFSEKLIGQNSISEKSISEKSFCEKSISEKSFCVGAKGSISAASSSTNLPYCGRLQHNVHKMHTTSKVHKANSGDCGRPHVHKVHAAQQHSRVHKTNMEDCSGPYVHKVNSAHNELLCVHGAPSYAHIDSCAETWQASTIGGKYTNSFGQEYPQIFEGEHAVSIGGQECGKSIGEGFGADRSMEEFGKCGLTPPSPNAPFPPSPSPPIAPSSLPSPSPPHAIALLPIYANVRRLQLPCLGE